MPLTEIKPDEFYMWRTLFAMVHADHRVRDEEIRFMAEAMEVYPFTEEQIAILKDDIYEPKDIEEMFRNVESAQLEARFFKFAHQLVWVDGEYHREEQAIMLDLLQAHIHKIDFDKLIGEIDLEFEKTQVVESDHTPCDVKNWIQRFKFEFFREENAVL